MTNTDLKAIYAYLSAIPHREACNTVAQPGYCATVRSAPDRDSCASPKSCDANGLCN